MDFIIPVYKDEEYAKRLILQIRQYHPGSSILVIADGVNPDGMTEFCLAQNVVYHPAPERLKTREFGGQWVERMFNLALKHLSSSIIVKLDADSYLHRALAEYQVGDISGAVRTNWWGGRFVRGGCVIYCRTAIQKILESETLKDSRYYHGDQFAYRRYGRFKFYDEADEADSLISHEDFIVGDCAQKLGLKIADHPEVADGIKFRELVPENDDQKIAVTHPVGITRRRHVIRQGLSVPGFTTANELNWLYGRVQGNAVEVGTYAGRSAVVMGLRLKDAGGHLTCIDPWLKYEAVDGTVIDASQAYDEFCENLKLTNIPCSVIRAFSVDVANEFEDGSLDFVFLDGDHTYEGLKADIHAWSRKLKLGGILCGHDYCAQRPEVIQVVDELIPGRQLFERIWWTTIGG